MSDNNRRHRQSNQATDLWYAADNGDYTRCETLISRGANVNIPNDYHWTPLYRAATLGHFEIAKLLLDNDADVNIPDDYNTFV